MSTRTTALATSAVRPIDWPPPPHDPRERAFALDIEGWQVRVFTGRKFEYFVTRGFWHLQLWHPASGVSVLTPSRLTCGFYEAYPVAHWKAQAATYEALVSLVAGITAAQFVSLGGLARVERCLVTDVVRGAQTATRRPLS